MNLPCFRSFVTLVLSSSILCGPGQAAERVKNGKTNCEMTFTLAGWSAIYKTAKGEGMITCDNGQSAHVTIQTKGGGLTFGKSKIEGKGVFSEAASIDDLFGSYATAEAHAGAVKSKSAQAMTKGEVSLAISGTGGGVDIGFAFGKFTIKRR